MNDEERRMATDSEPLTPISKDVHSAIETRLPSDRRASRNRISMPASPIRRVWLERLAHIALIAGIVALFGALWFAVTGTPRPAQVIAMAPAPLQTLLPTIIHLPTATPTATPTPLPPLVGLVAGHSGGADTGALCPDGLREVDITTDVAARAKPLLEARGYRVDILAEFDSRFNATKRDYSPQAFLAIHADSCVYNVSGYKVARASNSASPQEDDRLVRCVSSSYAAASQLPFHTDSITTDMTLYHSFMKINPQSPAAILELGFLGSDKAVLKNNRDQLAFGIANGVERFLQGSGCQ
jgi:N-acetylmuramoyl-L-alanine amidase